MASGMRIVDRISEGMELLQEAEPLAVQAGLRGREFFGSHRRYRWGRSF